MLELRHLRLFLEVAERGSFTATAKALSYTQPAVSQQVGALEKRVGTPLFDRSARGVKPTEAGELLQRHAKTMLAQERIAERELEELAGLRRGRVRIASFPTAGAALVPAAVSLFIERYPSVELSVLEAEPEDSIQMLRTGELDIALVAERKRPEGAFGDDLYASIEIRHLLDERMCLLVPADHPFARRMRLRLENVSEQTWIELGRGPAGPRGRVYLAADRASGLDERPAFRSDDFNVVQGMVAAGAGIALVPELALSNVRRDIRVCSLGRSAPMRSVAAATLAGVHRSVATAAALQTLAEVSDQHVASGRVGHGG